MDDLLIKRAVHNAITRLNGGNYSYPELETITQIIKDYEQNKNAPKKKVALLFICLGPNYWEYAKDAIEGARKYFLPGHQVDHFLWTDLGLYPEGEGVTYGAKVFDTEFQQWPAPTLLRYNLFLQQEDTLKDYDYIFYCDIDMRFVNVVGDEILGKGITAALHPMYAVRKNLWPPYEPNKESSAYIPRAGKVIADEGKPRFMPMYFAGGFQGGVSGVFLDACKKVRKMIDDDMNFRNYVAIWNDESYWNKYLFENEPEIVLSPSYIYPDSLIETYYEPLWGQKYSPKIVTLTKKHSLVKLSEKEQKNLADMQNIK